MPLPAAHILRCITQARRLPNRHNSERNFTPAFGTGLQLEVPAASHANHSARKAIAAGNLIAVAGIKGDNAIPAVTNLGADVEMWEQVSVGEFVPQVPRKWSIHAAQDEVCIEGTAKGMSVADRATNRPDLVVKAERLASALESVDLRCAADDWFICTRLIRI